MRPFERMHRGMGIGGWLTNFKRVGLLHMPKEKALELTVGDFEHFDTYITRRDIQNIRSMGMDHIRVPFDQVVIEELPRPVPIERKRSAISTTPSAGVWARGWMW